MVGVLRVMPYDQEVITHNLLSCIWGYRLLQAESRS